MNRIASAVLVLIPSGDSGFALGAAQYRRWHSAHPDRQGWRIVYHGVSEMAEPGEDYSAGVMVLRTERASLIRSGSAEPILTPVPSEDRRGTIGNIVFPTGIDRRDDLGSPNRFDVYYGMADYRIGVARFDVPDSVPPVGVAVAPNSNGVMMLARAHA
jgi:hypothetical protein